MAATVAAVTVAGTLAAPPVGLAYAPAQGCLGAPTTTQTDVPWPQQQLAPQRAWQLSEGAGITVAVVDTGVDANTPQLAGRVSPGTDVMKDGGGTANDDCFGHGTFVAGIIAAAPVAGTAFAGIAPEAHILPIRVATNDKDGTAALLGKGIRAAVDGGARVINVSSSTTARDPSLEQAVQYAFQHDVVVVAAAANGAQQGDPVSYPAAFDHVLGVGAVDASGARAQFSQTGSYVDLVAPGVDVVSVGPRGPGQWRGDGTSYAAPFVAGAAALVRAYRPSLSAEQVEHRLTATADHPAATLPDPGLGWGTIDPMAAVATVLPEEGAAGAARVVPEPVRRPPLKFDDDTGRWLTMLGAGALVIFAGTVALLAFLLPAGRRRRWRPARIARVRSIRS
jgi:membrane-anchored mycosin MYCP